MIPDGLPRTACAKALERRFDPFLPPLTFVTIVTAFRMRNVLQTFPTKAEEAILLDIWFSEPLTRGQAPRTEPVPFFEGFLHKKSTNLPNVWNILRFSY